MTLDTKNYIDQDYFQRVSAIMGSGLCLFRWQQPAKHYFLKVLFKHDFDVCYYAETSSAVFTVNGELHNIKRGGSIVISARDFYGFRGLEHSTNALICVAPTNAERDWLAVAAQLTP
jgi:hypothetical protein